ncbi:MAG: methylmalonyl Co-A mutase-associated GTPase MeaB, partial [Acidimicrobiia bacterium]
QAAKAGLLEVGDVFVVNQADLPGADAAVRRLIEMLELGPSGTWAPPVLAAVATTGEGLAEVGAAIAAHEVHVAGPGGDDDRAGTARNLVRAALEEEVALASGSLLATDRGAELVGAVARREIDPWTAARELRGYSG